MTIKYISRGFIDRQIDFFFKWVQKWILCFFIFFIWCHFMTYHDISQQEWYVMKENQSFLTFVKLCKHIYIHQMCTNYFHLHSEWKTTSMEDDLNGRRTQWKTNSTVNGISVRRPQEKTTSLWDNSMGKKLNGRRHQCKMTSMKDNIKGRLP